MESQNVRPLAFRFLNFASCPGGSPLLFTAWLRTSCLFLAAYCSAGGGLLSALLQHSAVGGCSPSLCSVVLPGAVGSAVGSVVGNRALGWPGADTCAWRGLSRCSSRERILWKEVMVSVYCLMPLRRGIPEVPFFLAFACLWSCECEPCFCSVCGGRGARGW